MKNLQTFESFLNGNLNEAKFTPKVQLMDILDMLNDGWRIISVTAREVSTGKSDVTEHGAFGILFEKFFPDETL
jgi:hypothetical protein